MRRRPGPILCSLALGMFALGAATPLGTPSASAATPGCAGATVTTTAGSSPPTAETIDRGGPPPADAPDGSCWVEAQPYPFGAQGEEVSGDCPLSESGPFSCYLTATSLAFRAWNRGLAATSEAPKGPNGGSDPYGVWIYNGDRWYPSPGFPGDKECPGHTILWGGKLDYWLVDGEYTHGTRGKWANLCRFDGEHNVWESLPMPEATTARIETATGPKPGTITTGTCFAWNNCWFFGTYGTVVHWDGHVLSDASPPRSETSLQGEYTAAVARQGPLGEAIGLATAATAEGENPVPLVQEGAAPPQLFGSSGGPFSPLPFAPPTIPQSGDPYRTDLVAVDLSSSGQGWAAGDPAGVRLGEREGQVPGERPSEPKRASRGSLSPLVPVSISGASAGCVGPPPGRFTYAPPTVPTAEVFLWSSIAAIPDGEPGGAGLAGGRWRRGEGSSQGAVEQSGEPIIARADCGGTTAVTRFVTSQGAPADQEGGVTAIAANAANDAWAATTKGPVERPPTVEEPPHLYRLTNGQPPEAPAGNDEEPIREVPQEDAPTIVVEPPQPEPPPPPPAVVPQTKTVTLPAAVYDVKTKVHETKRHGHIYLSLYLTFKVRRPVTIGAQALRRGHVVAIATPRFFAGQTGRLILSLNRKRWPTKVNFIS